MGRRHPMRSPKSHAPAERLFSAALRNNRLAHAYLLAGPEGAGKKTLARSFAMSILCDGRSYPPCEQCGPCRRVRDGSHPDLHWLLPEGRNIKIASVRGLTETLHLHSFEGGWKAGVVPKIELMKVETQNAFLKTLEEPPPDTVLVLTTDNVSSVLPTILSRCQTIRVGPMPRDFIRSLVAEQRGLDPEKAGLVAALAGGDASRALDMDLDLMVDFRRKCIEALQDIDKKDISAMLDFAQSVSGNGDEAMAVMDLLAGFYQDALHAKMGLRDFTNSDLAERIGREAKCRPIAEILAVLNNIHHARVRVAGNANPRLAWELLAMSIKGVRGAEIQSL